MKRRLYFILLILIFLTSCENPAKLVAPSISEPTSKPVFTRELICNGDNNNIGYLNGSVLSDQITLNWSKCTDKRFVNYLLYMDNSLIKKYQNNDSTHIVIDSLTQNSKHTFKLLTFINNGFYCADTISVKTANLAKPDQIKFSFVSDTSLKIRWENYYEGVTQYVILKNNNELLYSNSNNFTDNIIAGTTNNYQIKAKSQYEETPYSTIKSAVYTMQAPTIQSLTIIDTTDIKIQWLDNSTAESGFKVYRSINNNSPSNFDLIATLAADEEEYIDTSIKEVGNTYYYYISNFLGNQENNSTIMSLVLSNNLNIYLDFENNNGAFIADNWVYGTPSIISAHSGTKLWAISLNSNYDNDLNAYLESQPITLQNDSQMSFYHYLQTESNVDYGFLQIFSEDNIWHNLTSTTGYSYYTGHINEWVQTCYDLSLYDNQTVKLRWVFYSDSSVNNLGWFIDDVQINSTQINRRNK